MHCGATQPGGLQRYLTQYLALQCFSQVQFSRRCQPCVSQHITGLLTQLEDRDELWDVCAGATAVVL